MLIALAKVPHRTSRHATGPGIVALVVSVMVAAALSAGAAAGNTAASDDICAAFDSASAEAKELFSFRPRKDNCLMFYWERFEAEPAESLLGVQAHAVYRQHLDAGNCDAARETIFAAFLATYPDAPDIRSEPHDRFWSAHLVPDLYPELTFCDAMRDIRHYQAEIERLGIEPKRYIGPRQSFTNGLPAAVFWRNIALEDLDRLFFRKYPPAIAEVLDLSHDGSILKLHPQFEYYMLLVLEKLDQAVPRLEVRRKRARSMLSETEAHAVEQQAESSRYVGPEMYLP